MLKTHKTNDQNATLLESLESLIDSTHVISVISVGMTKLDQDIGT